MPDFDPATTALLTVECQNGVVGEESALPELAKEARDSGMLGRVAALADAARRAGVQVLHAVAERRPDGRGPTPTRGCSGPPKSCPCGSCPGAGRSRSRRPSRWPRRT